MDEHWQWWIELILSFLWYFFGFIIIIILLMLSSESFSRFGRGIGRHEYVEGVGVERGACLSGSTSTTNKNMFSRLQSQQTPGRPMASSLLTFSLPCACLCVWVLGVCAAYVLLSAGLNYLNKLCQCNPRSLAFFCRSLPAVLWSLFYVVLLFCFL